jgi:hypothetical protein
VLLWEINAQLKRFATETIKILLWNNTICFTAEIFGATCELGCFHLLSKLSFLTFVLKVKKKRTKDVFVKLPNKLLGYYVFYYKS